MPGTFSPAADFKENRLLAIPACITARAWRTCRDVCRDRLHAVTGKTFPAFPAHAHPQFYVSGKRPMNAMVLYPPFLSYSSGLHDRDLGTLIRPHIVMKQPWKLWAHIIKTHLTLQVKAQRNTPKPCAYSMGNMVYRCGSMAWCKSIPTMGQLWYGHIHQLERSLQCHRTVALTVNCTECWRKTPQGI